MRRHLIQLVDVAVRIHVAETGPHGLVDEKQVGELIPRARVVLQCVVIFESVGANLHQRTVHRAATGPTVQPNDSPLSVRDMSVLEMPEEKVAIALWIDLDVAVKR